MDKLLNLLTICTKAGKAVFGFDSCVTSLKTGECKLLITSSDISPKTKKELDFFLTKNNLTVPQIQIPYTKTELVTYFKRQVAVLGICDSGFVQAIIKAGQ
jgi:ribosomal protein L30E